MLPSVSCDSSHSQVDPKTHISAEVVLVNMVVTSSDADVVACSDIGKSESADVVACPQRLVLFF